jgi:hypothetical protein
VEDFFEECEHEENRLTEVRDAVLKTQATEQTSSDTGQAPKESQLTEV